MEHLTQWELTLFGNSGEIQHQWGKWRIENKQRHFEENYPSPPHIL